jgi:hypothetical protein
MLIRTTSGPIGVVPIVLLYFVWPKDNHSTNIAARAKLQDLDFVGSLLMICGSVPMVVALQQAGSRVWAWNSGPTIALLTVSVFSWIALFAWQYLIDVQPRLHQIRPSFPLALVKNRVMISTIV